MKTSEIPYTNLSTDYGRLYELLKNGFKIVGFVERPVDGMPEKVSKVCVFEYDKEKRVFYIDGPIFEHVPSADIFDYMKSENVRFFDLPKQCRRREKYPSCPETAKESICFDCNAWF